MRFVSKHVFVEIAAFLAGLLPRFFVFQVCPFLAPKQRSVPLYSEALKNNTPYKYDSVRPFDISEFNVDTVISSEFPPEGDVYFLRKTITPGVTQRSGFFFEKTPKILLRGEKSPERSSEKYNMLGCGSFVRG